ncbi:MAG: hypothetical protein OK438_06285 [Thaumarchaeota archaeon]|nr:hypothetical protein [Nitrososphaerota archaeon]
MKTERLISEVNTPEDARKVEESIKTGYLETTIDSLLQWIGVEEDLVSSYEALAHRSGFESSRAVFKQLQEESKKNIALLSSLQRSFEELDRARVQRLKLLSSIEP